MPQCIKNSLHVFMRITLELTSYNPFIGNTELWLFGSLVLGDGDIWRRIRWERVSLIVLRIADFKKMLLICIFSLVSDGKTLRTSEFESEYRALKPRCPNPLKEPLTPLICKWKVCKDLMLLLKKSAPRLTAAPLLRNAVTRWNKQLLKRITWVCIWEDEKLIDMNNLLWCDILYKWNRRERVKANISHISRT